MIGGEVADYKDFDLLVDDDLPHAKVALADRGYDSDHIRNIITSCGGTPAIIAKSNRKTPILVDTISYALSARHISSPHGSGSRVCQHDLVLCHMWSKKLHRRAAVWDFRFAQQMARPITIVSILGHQRTLPSDAACLTLCLRASSRGRKSHIRRFHGL